MSVGGGSVTVGGASFFQLNPSDTSIPPGAPANGTHAHRPSAPTVFTFLEGFAVTRFFAFFAFFMGVSGCSIPDPPAPLLVRPIDLARDYHDAPIAARKAYDGQTIRLPLSDFHLDHGRYVWSLGASTDSPPVVILDLIDQPGARSHRAWVEGSCRGSVPDAVRRESLSYTFTIRITDCRLVLPPTTPAR